MTNSDMPRANVPKANAIKLFFIGVIYESFYLIIYISTVRILSRIFFPETRKRITNTARQLLLPPFGLDELFFFPIGDEPYFREHGRHTRVAQHGKVCSLGCEKLTDREGATGAAIRLSDDGAFLYCSVRGENSLYVFKTQKEGALKFVQKTDCFGDGPRDFNLYQNKYIICCNENSGNVTIFPLENEKIGNKSGELKLLSPLCCVTE